MDARHILLFLVAVNLWTAFRFWQDKQRARTGGRRIAEADFLATR
jgi:uncharacterized membrane protein YsdA (DUF1294 family)